MTQSEKVENFLKDKKWKSITEIVQATSIPRPTVRRLLSEGVRAGKYKRQQKSTLDSIRFCYAGENSEDEHRRIIQI